MRILIVFLLFILNAGGVAHGQALFNFCRPAEAMGMGGVYLPFVREELAPLHNASSLAFAQNISWEIFDLTLGANGMDMVQSVSGIGGGGPGSFAPLYGKPLWLYWHGTTSGVAPYFGLTGFNCGYFSGTLVNPPFPSMNTTYINDYGFIASGALKVGPETSIGLGVKRIQRHGGTVDLGPSIIASGDVDALIDQFD
ncbi:MAG: hypothetical protein N2578_00395, partial [Bdellovibrionaceae bacterium]|nr:hypothetical protein [Pseudobdellovibrionaceae bacterium]